MHDCLHDDVEVRQATAEWTLQQISLVEAKPSASNLDCFRVRLIAGHAMG